MKTRLIVLSAVAILPLLLTASAYASDAPVVFRVGNCGNCDETNVFFTGGDQGPALMITGHLDNAHGNFPVLFTTTPGNLLFGSGGQSDIDPCNGGPPCDVNPGFIHSVTVSVPSGFFADYIFDPQILEHKNDLEAFVHTNMGDATFGPWGSHLNGQNYLTIRANPGVEILSVTVTSVAGFGDLKQNRISGVNGTPGGVTPEVSSLMLMGTGILGLAGVLRRKLRRDPLEKYKNKPHLELKECS